MFCCVEITYCRFVIGDVFQITEQLKSVESGNQMKEDEVQMKKKLIDLLPDADANIRKLEVGEFNIVMTRKQIVLARVLPIGAE